MARSSFGCFEGEMSGPRPRTLLGLGKGLCFLNWRWPAPLVLGGPRS
jgi:hypothetical protein